MKGPAALPLPGRRRCLRSRCRRPNLCGVVLRLASIAAHLRHWVVAAGELTVKLKPEDLGLFAAAIVERLVPILQNTNSMPRSITENRWERFFWKLHLLSFCSGRCCALVFPDKASCL